MAWKKPFRDLLSDELNFRKKKDPNYSLRAYAKDLGLSVGGLSGLLNNRMDLSVDRAAAVTIAMGLPHHQMNSLLAMMGYPIVRKETPIDGPAAIVFSSWKYFAILRFFGLDSRIPSAEIATRLALSVEEVDEVVAKLVEVGILEKSESGEYFENDINWVGGRAGPNENVRRYHLHNLELSRMALDNVPASERDFSTFIFCGGKDELESVRKEINEMQIRISSRMATAKPHTEVYSLSVALFPLNMEKKNENN